MESYTCTEYIHTDNLRRILKANKVNDEEQVKMLKKLFKSVYKDGKQSIEFILKEKFSKVKAIGRLYPKYNRPSLQGLKRNIRKALAHHRYTDCDIKNAHPVLMHQVFEKENIECRLLTEYVADRERFLETASKKEWTRMLNNGRPRSDATQLEKDFWSDVIIAGVELFNKPEYEIYHKIAQIRNPDNKLGYAVSALATDLERKCITTAIQSFQEQGFRTGTIIHDGFLIEALEIDDGAFRMAEEEIKDRVGFDVTLVKSQLNDFDPNELWEKEQEELVPDVELNDASAAKEFIKFMDELGHHFTKCCGTFLWYNPTTGLWKECPKADELRAFMNGARERLDAYSSFVSKQDNLFTMLKAFTEEDPTFYVKAPQTTYRRLAFNNGVYNFETKQLDGFQPEFRFFHKLEWDWDAAASPSALADEIRQKIIYGTFDRERGDYYEKVLARSLAGEVQDKNFFVITGDGNSGKGVNSDLLENTFGGFVGVFNSANLTKKIKGDDTEKTLGFMTQLKGKRIVYANETSPDCVFDAGMIKTFASGGDTLKARPLFKDPQTFKLECSPFLFCNDFNTIRGADDATSNRLRFLESQYAYLTGSNYEDKKKNPNVKLGDDNIKNVFIKRQDVLKTFAMMICDAYSTTKPVEPDCVQRETKEWVQHDDMETIIDGLIEFDEGHEVSFGEVYNHLTQNGVAVSKTKAGTLLKKLGFNQIQKKINKKKGRYYQNLKLSTSRPGGVFGDY
jgi:hypothetical protein